ncbi:MAG: hypothetical protein IJT16_12940 [Lachnospiraceae bacterium]|nr:hypothetical protein [Lachnospiraceae bacterium]
MKSILKRVCAGLLTFAVLFTGMPLTAFAAGDTGSSETAEIQATTEETEGSSRAGGSALPKTADPKEEAEISPVEETRENVTLGDAGEDASYDPEGEVQNADWDDDPEEPSAEGDSANYRFISTGTPVMTPDTYLDVDWEFECDFSNYWTAHLFGIFVCKGETSQVAEYAPTISNEDSGAMKILPQSGSCWVMKWGNEEDYYTPVPCGQYREEIGNARDMVQFYGNFSGLLDWYSSEGKEEPKLQPGDTCTIQLVYYYNYDSIGYSSKVAVSNAKTFKVSGENVPKVTLKNVRITPSDPNYPNAHGVDLEAMWDMENFEPEEDGVSYYARLAVAKGDYTKTSIYQKINSQTSDSDEFIWWMGKCGDAWGNSSVTQGSQCSAEGGIWSNDLTIQREPEKVYGNEKFAAGDQVTLCLRIYRLDENAKAHRRDDKATVYETSELYTVTDEESELSLILGKPTLYQDGTLKQMPVIMLGTAHGGHDGNADKDYKPVATVRVCKGDISNFSWESDCWHYDDISSHTQNGAERDSEWGDRYYTDCHGSVLLENKKLTWSGTDKPTLNPGDVCSAAVEIRKLYHSGYGDDEVLGVIYRSEPISFTVTRSPIVIEQPDVWPSSATFDLSTGTEQNADISLRKDDGTFIFDSIRCGETILTKGKDYAVSENGQTVTIRKSFLKTLSEGSYTLVFHYTVPEKEYPDDDYGTPEDPTVSLKVIRSASATVKVLNRDGVNVADKCRFEWGGEGIKNNGSPTVVTNYPTELTYKIEPGDKLELDGEQFYETITGTIQSLEGGNVDTKKLKELGQAVVSVKSGDSDVPNESGSGYNVVWYSRDPAVYGDATPDAEGYAQIGTGTSSPKVPAGSVLYYDVLMTGRNRDDYRDILKDDILNGGVTTVFGKINVIADATNSEKIVLNITGAKHSGEALTPEDYRITWYRKNGKGEYEALRRTGNLLGEHDVQTGETLYYEIMPMDRYGADGDWIHNWLDFYGVPLKEAEGADPGTAVTFTGKSQFINVPLGLVQKSVLTGSVTNASAVIAASGEDSLRLSLTQEPWGGYTGKYNNASYDYSYYDTLWKQAEFTTEMDGDALLFEVPVYDLDAMVRAEDTGYNFETSYKSILPANLGEPAAITMKEASLPTQLRVNLKRTYATDRKESGTDTNEYGTNTDTFRKLVFTLENLTKKTTIAPEDYRISGNYIYWNDRNNIASYISMGDSLKLSMAFPEGDEDDPGVVLGTVEDTLTVKRNWKDTPEDRFDLSFTEYGKMQFTTTTSQKEPKVTECFAIYNSKGTLLESRSKYVTRSAESGLLPAGDYTLIVWQKSGWYAAASTLEQAHGVLDAGTYQEKTFTIENGKLTRLALDHTPRLLGESLFSAEGSGFSDATVEAGLDEWKLLTLNYSVDPKIRRDNPDAAYQITVKKAHSSNWVDKGFTNVDLKCRTGYKYGVPDTDQNIVLYSDGTLDKDSRVTIDFRDENHIADVYGFTLETKKPEGKILFYLRGGTGGDYPVTASGRIKGENTTSYALGEMNLRIDEAGALSFTSDYLREGNNGVWTYTIPSRDVVLYMDGVEIAKARANSFGTAFFTFTIDDAFRALFAGKEDWSLNGLHELYAITDPTKENVKSPVSSIRYAKGFAPAVLKGIQVRTTSDYDKDHFSGRTMKIFEFTGRGGSLSSNYWSPSDKGTYYTYDFTVTFENADSLETKPENGKHDPVYMWITGQDGEEYLVPLTRKQGTNDYTGSVTEKGLLFNSWGISFTNKLPEHRLRWVDDLKVSDLPAFEDGTTAAQYYEKLMSAETDPADPEKGCLGTATEEELNELLAVACDSIQDFYEEAGIITEENGFTFDGSEASLEKLNDVLGIREGTATGEDKIFDYEGWESWKDVEISKIYDTDGNLWSIGWVNMETEGNYIWLEEYYVRLPEDGDSGYERLTVTRIDDSESGGELASFISKSGLDNALLKNGIENLMADGHVHDKYAQFSGETLRNMKNFNSGLRKAIGTLQGGAARTSYQLNFMKQHLKDAQNVTGGSGLAGESTAITELRTNVAILQKLAEDGKFGAVSEVYAKRFAEYQQRLTNAEKYRDTGVGKQILSDIKALANTITTARSILKIKGAKDALDFLSDGNVAAQLASLGIDVASKDWKGLAGLALDKLLDKLDEALQKKIRESEKDIHDIMEELFSDFEMKGLMKKAQEENNNSGGSGGNGGIRNIKPSDVSGAIRNGGGSGRGTNVRPAGGRSAAIHDPEGIVYEAVLSNPVVGATATLYQAAEKDASGEVTAETVWNAEDYGQINPQVTASDGQYQWFVPDGYEYKVKVTAPEGSGLSDNDSSQHPAALLNDGSAAGWLPVLPVQMGINIPLESVNAPTVVRAEMYDNRAVVSFSLYMDTSTLSEDVVQILDGTEKVPVLLSFPDEEASPAGDGRILARTMILTPVSDSGFAKTAHTIRIGKEAMAYNHKFLQADYASEEIVPQPLPYDIRASKTVLELAAESTEAVTVTLTDENGEPISGASVSAISTDPSVASVPVTETTSKSGTAEFTVTALEDGITDIIFTPADIMAIPGEELPSCRLAVNVGKTYAYDSHEVSWGSYDVTTGEVYANFHVLYRVGPSTESYIEETDSGPVKGELVRTSGVYKVFRASFATRDTEHPPLSEEKIFNTENGQEKPEEDYSYEGETTGEVTAFFADQIDLEEPLSLTYTGEKLTPQVCVVDGKKLLIEGVDYTLSYANNLNASDKKKGDAGATVRFKGTYKKQTQQKLNFKILPADLSDPEVVVGNTVIVSGKKAAPVLAYMGKTLAAKRDYAGVPATKLKEDTTFTVTAGTNGNFTGEREITVKVLDKKEIGGFAVKLTKASFTYDGSEKRLTVAGPVDTMDCQLTVTDKKSKEVLTEGVDFALSYSPNINAGTVRFVVIGLGKYNQTVKKTFKISPAVWTKKKSAGITGFTITNQDTLSAGFAYTGATLTPFIGIAAETASGKELILIPGKDYKVGYSKNKNKGKAKATVTFLGNFKGSKLDPVTFEIK